MDALLEMRGIEKCFSGVRVLSGVDFVLERGKIHALLGENGAGKTTLMNILTGVIPADGGSIVFDGRPMHNVTIANTEAAGIAFVHQELDVINDLTVFENIFLNRELTGAFGCLKKEQMRKTAKKLFSDLGVSIDPDTMVSDLKTSEKQLLEIAKALFRNAKLMILDEPTTALNNDEVDHLFEILRGLKEKGTAFVFISHKMPEIFRISDSYTVLRNGQHIASGAICNTTPSTVAALMVGNSACFENRYAPRPVGEPVLELEHLSGTGFSDVSLTVRKGEILGMTGLQGSGSGDLLRCIFGDTAAQTGSLKIAGERIASGSIHAAMRSGVAMLPADRKENSVIGDMCLLENMYISEHTLSAMRFHICQKEEISRYETQKKKLSIKAENPFLSITSLSGGNQQKVFLARWLNTQANVLLLDNPTQGIDVGAKGEIYGLILELAKQGKTILVNTLEIPELQQVADRCAVFYEGRLVKILAHEEIDERQVMLYSTNAIRTGEIP